jgi:hypothetical protein
VSGVADIHERIGEKVELAGVYAADGAYHTAARILREAAMIAEEHAELRSSALRTRTGRAQ